MNDLRMTSPRRPPPAEQIGFVMNRGARFVALSRAIQEAAELTEAISHRAHERQRDSVELCGSGSLCGIVSVLPAATAHSCYGVLETGLAVEIEA